MKPLAVNRFLAALTFALIVSVGVPLETSAQAVRSVQTFYVRPQIGLTSYIGDRSAALFSFGQAFPYAAGLELGYQFERPYSVGFNYHFAHSPAIRPGGASSARHSLDAPFRYTFIENGATLRNSTGPAPYLTLGPHVTIGSAYPDGTNGPETRIAFGPLAGVGVDVPLNDHVSLFFEGATRAAFPDDAADGLKTDKFAGFDLLSTLNAGLKIGFKSGAVPPGVVAIEGPAQLDVGQPGTFTANVDGDATHPVEYRWHWEDGTVSAGLAATRTFSEPGTYTVTFAASNRAGAHSETLTVAVMAVEIPDPPEIRFIAAEPDSVDTETPVRFTTQVQGEAPISYRWTFGDGSSATSTSPTHTFEEAGTYTVSLQVTNEFGSDTQTLQLDIAAYDTLSCPQLTSLSAVPFEMNSSILTEAGQRAAEQNVQTLLVCPGMQIRIIGSASPGERNQQALSEDRSRAVMEFYTSNGIPVDRVTMNGLTNGGRSLLGEPGQRADTVPIR